MLQDLWLGLIYEILYDLYWLVLNCTTNGAAENVLVLNCYEILHEPKGFFL